MISKILAGVLAAAVLTVGGYAYWQYASGTPECVAEPSATSSCPVSLPAPCCQEPSRTQAVLEKPCCCESDEDASPEVLAIQPRELK